MKRAVFLDRDGVINRTMLVDGVPRPPASIVDIEILEGVVEAIQLLKTNDFVPVVVTNQPDVIRGTTTQIEVDLINSFIADATDIEYFYTCFHDDADQCNCRKPAPGLLLWAAKILDLDLPRSFLVGDRWRDISAGQAAGCQSFFIDYSYPERSPAEPFTKVLSLLDATQIIIGELDDAK